MQCGTGDVPGVNALRGCSLPVYTRGTSSTQIMSTKRRGARPSPGLVVVVGQPDVLAASVESGDGPRDFSVKCQADAQQTPISTECG